MQPFVRLSPASRGRAAARGPRHCIAPAQHELEFGKSLCQVSQLPDYRACLTPSHPARALQLRAHLVHRREQQRPFSLRASQAP
eukprot:6186860-Pleurochrysis_carterae.AAC.1